MGERWLCAWCGANLEPLQTGWTDVESRSGEYCPDGQAVRDWGTSPHLPVRAEAAAQPAAPAGLDVPDYPDDFNPYLHQTLTRLASKWRDESKWDGRGDIYLRCADELDRVAAAYAEGEPER